MKYRNTITGIEFESKCVISGEHFEAVGQKVKSESTETKTAKPKTTTTKRTKK